MPKQSLPGETPDQTIRSYSRAWTLRVILTSSTNSQKSRPTNPPTRIKVVVGRTRRALGAPSCSIHR
jgi:hypothetical protein